MRVDVEVEIDIGQPPEAVAAVAADPSRAPEWYRRIRSVEWVTEPPARQGSRVAFVARFLGRRLAYTYELVEYDPPRTVVMRTAEGPFPMETTYRWQPVGATSTRMSLRNCGEPAGFSRLMTPLMAPMMRRAMQGDLERLRALVASG